MHILEVKVWSFDIFTLKYLPNTVIWASHDIDYALFIRYSQYHLDVKPNILILRSFSVYAGIFCC